MKITGHEKGEEAHRDVPVKKVKYLIIKGKEIEFGLKPIMDSCLVYYLLYCVREREVVYHR